MLILMMHDGISGCAGVRTLGIYHQQRDPIKEKVGSGVM